MSRLGGSVMTTTIRAHLTTLELERRYETAVEPVEKSDFHALWLLSRGHDLDKVAEIRRRTKCN